MQNQYVIMAKSNVSLFLKHLSLVASNAEIAYENEIVYAYSGFDTQHLNCIIGADPANDKDFSQTVFKIVSFYAQKRAYCSWWMSKPKEPIGALETMNKLGFKYISILKGMQLDLAKFIYRPNKIKDFNVVCVDSAQAFKDFVGVYFNFVPDSHKKDFTLYFDLALENKNYISDDVKFFIGYNNQEPVCIGKICLSDDVVGLYDVFTILKARKQGFATALTSVMLTKAKELGAKIAILQSSFEAVNIYSPMGFEFFEEFFVFNNEDFMRELYSKEP